MIKFLNDYNIFLTTSFILYYIKIIEKIWSSCSNWPDSSYWHYCSYWHFAYYWYACLCIVRVLAYACLCILMHAYAYRVWLLMRDCACLCLRELLCSYWHYCNHWHFFMRSAYAWICVRICVWICVDIKRTMPIVSPNCATEARLTQYEIVKCEDDYTRYELYMTRSTYYVSVCVYVHISKILRVTRTNFFKI